MNVEAFEKILRIAEGDMSQLSTEDITNSIKEMEVLLTHANRQLIAARAMLEGLNNELSKRKLLQ